MKQLIRIVAASLLFAMLSGVSFAGDPASRTLVFDVFLDGKKIGYHRFEIDGSEMRPSSARRVSTSSSCS